MNDATHAQPSGTPSGTAPGSSPAPWLTRRRAAVLFLQAVVLPALFLTFLEGTLRWSGYGFATTLFVPCQTSEGRKMAVNYRAGWRYFPPQMARRPLPEQFPAEKTPGTFRIFVLGESAARGEFLADYSFSRMLREMLRVTWPERRIELINTGIPAINSWILREFAREIGGYQPDLVILYAGHNEVVGPFGPGTVFAPMSSPPAIRTELWLSGLRLTQLARSMAETVGLGKAQAAPEAWKGLEMFLQHRIPPLDPRVDDCATNFQANVEDIIRFSRDAGAGVIVCQVPSNLRDCPPFASLNTPGLPPAQASRWNTAFQAGLTEQAAGHPASAAAAFQAAAAADPGHAETRFRLGTCLLALGKQEDAQSAFAQARDLDSLRFRAVGPFNARLATAVGKRGPDPELTLIDLEKVFADHSPHRIPGKELVYDHVHLTLAGHSLVATTLFRTLTDRFSHRLPPIPGAPPRVPDRSVILERLGFSPFDEIKNLESILASFRQAPFTSLSNNEASCAELKEQIAAKRQELGGKAPQLILAVTDALARDPDNPDLLLHLARLYVEAGRPSESLLYFGKALEKNPFNIDAYNNRGLVALALGQTASAAADFQAALVLAPNFAGAHFNLGITLAREHRVEEAVLEYTEALRYDPGYLKARLNLGNLLFQAGKTEAAIAHYRAALATASGSAEIHLNLGNALLKNGEPALAVSHYTTATTLDPGSASGFYGLGNAMTRIGRDAEASQAFRAALTIDPDHLPSLKRAALLLATSENPDIRSPAAAIELGERACSLMQAQDPSLLQVLTAAYAEIGRTEDACRTARTAIELATAGGDQALAEELRANLSQIETQSR